VSAESRWWATGSEDTATAPVSRPLEGRIGGGYYVEFVLPQSEYICHSPLRQATRLTGLWGRMPVDSNFVRTVVSMTNPYREFAKACPSDACEALCQTGEGIPERGVATLPPTGLGIGRAISRAVQQSVLRRKKRRPWFAREFPGRKQGGKLRSGTWGRQRDWIIPISLGATNQCEAPQYNSVGDAPSPRRAPQKSTGGSRAGVSPNTGAKPAEQGKFGCYLDG